jgi:hypothetical protein
VPCRRSRRDGRDMVLNVYIRIIWLLSDVNITLALMLLLRQEQKQPSVHLFSLRVQKPGSRRSEFQGNRTRHMARNARVRHETLATTGIEEIIVRTRLAGIEFNWGGTNDTAQLPH